MVFRFEGATLYEVVEDAAFESSANAVASFQCVSMILEFTCILRLFNLRYNLGRVSYEVKNVNDTIII